MKKFRLFLQKLANTYGIFFCLTLILFLIIVPIEWIMEKLSSRTGTVQIDWKLLFLAVFCLPLIVTIILAFFDGLKWMLLKFRHNHDQ